MKISTVRLKQIINEELFNRELRPGPQELEEAQKTKDERISRKISYLVDKEGKSKDQAVAIAHSMEERGELEEAAEKRGSKPDPQFSNLRRFDPKEKQPSDPEKIGLDTLEMTPGEFAKFMRRNK